MIAVDTSALMAIALNEPQAAACAAALEANDDLLISAGTVAEALIVSARRNVGDEVASMSGQLGFDIVTVTSATAHRVSDVYARWGKGAHPAALNFGDCFAYDAAKEHGCPLLYVDENFSRTDIERVI